MTAVLLIGIAVQDFVFGVETLPSGGEKYRAQKFDVVGGGLAANAAVAVARLGGEARFITRLGDDAIARDILDELDREGVDCSLARRFPGCRSPLSAIAVDRNGERMILNYADPSLPAETSWLPDALPAGIDAVLGDTRWPEGACHLFGLARASARPAVLDADRAMGVTSAAEAATHVAWSAQALREFTGRDNVQDAFAQIVRNARNWVAVTDGARGVWYLDEGRVAHMPAFHVEIIDTLGAGDTFHGALALALGERQSARDAVRFASAAAALKCTKFGGRRGIPARPEVEAFLRGA